MVGCRRRPGGFTLIELVLVMIVIFTVATVVAPRLTDFFPSFQVRKTSQRLFAWARKARADAATTGLRHRLLLDPQAQKYWIEYEARPFKEPGKFVVLGGSWGEERFPDAVRYESIDGAETDSSRSGCRYVEFRPDGTSTEATIQIADDRNDRSVLRVEGASSKVYIQAQEGTKS
ncbi:MAG TPA: prepilin-type N-terminal cleavage/methylation domain-containing protein [Planctomycetota bacterium]|nr:prepilin-type N-terminal cleavage/methylation domain-containing protein [Planctomycetota bacterium]